MGQAKLRGTFEDRSALAEKRNAEILEKLIEPAPADSPAKKFFQRRGIQRLAMTLICAGLISHDPHRAPVLVARE